MPLIRIDYNDQDFNSDAVSALVQAVLGQSLKTFKTNPDLVSVFSKAYEPHDHSTASAEIEVRAKVAEFDDANLTRDQKRDAFIAEYRPVLAGLLTEHMISKPVISSITFEDWKVEMISA